MNKSETQKYVQDLQGHIKILQKENDELKTENAELHCEIQAINAMPDSEYAKKLEEENERLRKSCDRHRRKICDIESELSVKENLLKIKNGLCGENDLSGLTPIKAADLIIENFKQGTYPIYEIDYEGNIKYMDVEGEKYPIETGMYRKYEEVKQIAEHLLVYCNHNLEGNK